MGRATIAAAGIIALVAGTTVLYRQSVAPLWPGARYSLEERNRAMRRGLVFLYSAARQPNVLRDWGHDLLSAFGNIATTCGTREISDLAWRMGHERALEWRRLFHEVPLGATSVDIANLVYGSDAAELLDVPDRGFHEALRQAAARFSPVDYLGFDPVREPPPARDRYGVFQDALIDTYTGEHYGVPLGGRYADVLHWLPTLHPYPTRAAGRSAYYDAIYTVTHVIYTYNSYNLNRIPPACFPLEFAYLRDNLPQALRDGDPEVLGEYLDSLQAFGMTWSDPEIRRGVEYMLSVQNADGSWGDPHEKDMYTRYHSTWTGINGIQDFRWSRVLPCPAR